MDVFENSYDEYLKFGRTDTLRQKHGRVSATYRKQPIGQKVNKEDDAKQVNGLCGRTSFLIVAFCFLLLYINGARLGFEDVLILVFLATYRNSETSSTRDIPGQMFYQPFLFLN